MDWGHLFVSIFKAFFIAIPFWFCYIAIKIKIKMWRDKK
tara:strand:- start:1205 stop:1321 length:117 start_codon:yes stop_codon:yes gene_type:complete